MCESGITGHTSLICSVVVRAREYCPPSLPLPLVVGQGAGPPLTQQAGMNTDWVQNDTMSFDEEHINYAIYTYMDFENSLNEYLKEILSLITSHVKMKI